jgi:hypothetical protein
MTVNTVHGHREPDSSIMRLLLALGADGCEIAHSGANNLD